MENSLIVALSRQSVLSRQMDTISNNLANMTTAGFKAENLVFKEQVEKTGKRQELSLVYDVTYFRDVAEGPMTSTGNPLDLAIRGDGFFAIQTPEGQRYTREGVFQLDNANQVVTADGNLLLGAGGAPLTVPANASNIVVARDGTLSADTAQIGRIEVFRFDNAAALTKVGNSLYDAKDQAPAADRDSQIVQGMVEGSNVNGVVEMTRLIDTVRSYQAASKLVDMEHQRILEAINGLVADA